MSCYQLVMLQPMGYESSMASSGSSHTGFERFGVEAWQRPAGPHSTAVVVREANLAHKIEHTLGR